MAYGSFFRRRSHQSAAVQSIEVRGVHPGHNDGAGTTKPELRPGIPANSLVLPIPTDRQHPVQRADVLPVSARLPRSVTGRTEGRPNQSQRGGQ